MVVHELVHTPTRVRGTTNASTDALRIGVAVGRHAARVIEVGKVAVDHGDVIGLAKIDRSRGAGIGRLTGHWKVTVLVDPVEPDAIEDDVVGLSAGGRKIHEVV